MSPRIVVCSPVATFTTPEKRAARRRLIASTQSPMNRKSRRADPSPQITTSDASASRASTKRLTSAATTWEFIGWKLSCGP